MLNPVASLGFQLLILYIYIYIYIFGWEFRESPNEVQVFLAGDASLLIFLYCHSLVVMNISLSMTALYITRSSVFVTGNSCKCTVSE